MTLVEYLSKFHTQSFNWFVRFFFSSLFNFAWAVLFALNWFVCVRASICAAGGQTFGVRHLQALLLFMGLTLAYAMRVNLSVAIVAITDKHAANPAFTVSCLPTATRSPSHISLNLLCNILWFIHKTRTTNGTKKPKHWCWAASFGAMSWLRQLILFILFLLIEEKKLNLFKFDRLFRYPLANWLNALELNEFYYGRCLRAPS